MEIWIQMLLWPERCALKTASRWAGSTSCSTQRRRPFTSSTISRNQPTLPVKKSRSRGLITKRQRPSTWPPFRQLPEVCNQGPPARGPLLGSTRMHFMELANEAPRLDCHHSSHAAVNRWRRDGFSVQREFTARTGQNRDVHCV